MLTSGWLLLLGIAIVAGTVFALALCFHSSLRRWLLQREVEQACQTFRRQREVLEARFFDLASRLEKPRGLRWVDCDWLDRVVFCRDRQSGLLSAFVSINIRFEAIEGGEMEGVAAVGNIRMAAAVFHYEQGNWGTGGRALFNLTADDALERMQGQFEPVAPMAAA